MLSKLKLFNIKRLRNTQIKSGVQVLSTNKNAILFKNRFQIHSEMVGMKAMLTRNVQKALERLFLQTYILMWQIYKKNTLSSHALRTQRWDLSQNLYSNIYLAQCTIMSILGHYPTTLDVNELDKYFMVQLLFLTFINVCYLDK